MVVLPLMRGTNLIDLAAGGLTANATYLAISIKILAQDEDLLFSICKCLVTIKSRKMWH